MFGRIIWKIDVNRENTTLIILCGYSFLINCFYYYRSCKSFLREFFYYSYRYYPFLTANMNTFNEVLMPPNLLNITEIWCIWWYLLRPTDTWADTNNTKPLRGSQLTKLSPFCKWRELHLRIVVMNACYSPF